MCRTLVRYPSLESARVAVRAAGTGDHVRFCTRCCGWHTEPTVTYEAPMTRTKRTGLVDATGTRRRIEALAAIGHTADTIGAHMQRPPATARSLISSWRRRDRRRIDARTAAQVAQVYTALADQTGTSPTTANRAQRVGCLPPSAWAGLDIDDPATQPRTDTKDQAA